MGAIAVRPCSFRIAKSSRRVRGRRAPFSGSGADLLVGLLPLLGQLADCNALLREHSLCELARLPVHCSGAAVDRNLMADDAGAFPLTSLNEWEREVVPAELKRSSSRTWYRDPPRQTVDSVGVTCREDVGNWRSMHPDLVFFSEVHRRIEVSMLDPHGSHLADSLGKLKAFARFAGEFGGEFHRIEALAKVGTKMRVLDLQQDTVCAGLRSPTRRPLTCT